MGKFGNLSRGRKQASDKSTQTKDAKAGSTESKSAAPAKGTATASNGASSVYMDTFNKHPDCQKDKDKIAKECKPEPEQTAAEKKAGKPAKKSGIAGMLSKATHAVDELGRTATGYKRTAENAWVDSHCDGMWTKPKNLKNASAEMNKAVTDSMEKLKSEKWGLANEALKELTAMAQERAGAAATKKIVGLGARSVLKNLVGGAAMVGTAGTVGTVVEAGMIAWTITDVLSTAAELAAMVGPDGVAILANIKDSVHIEEKLDSMIKEYKEHPDKALADSMKMNAQFSKCLRARRCQLVQMKKTSAKAAAKSGEGCCPGQTGHHLLPREMFEDCPDYGSESGSVHKNALVTCVEGTTQNHGSHGTVHGKMDGLMKKHRDKAPGKDSITNDEAIDAAAESHTEAFKPACDKKCLKAQLAGYYSKLCDGKMKPRGGMGTDTEAGDVGSGETKGR